MSDFIRTVRGSDLVADEAGLQALEVLGPILVVAPDDAEAVEAASRTVARMSPDSMVAAVLDWWFFVTTGTASPLGLAFRLPDAIPFDLRNSMEAVASLTHHGLQVPPARWVLARRVLDRLLADLDHHLVLDSYGKSKLPGEREAWAYLQAELHPIVDALTAGRQVEPFELDERSYEKEMKRSGIDENSRRWNEMVKRASECVARVNEVVDVHKAVEPWIDRDVPPVVDAVPGELTAEFGPLSHLVFASVTAPQPEDGSIPAGYVADRLEQTAAGLGEADQSWLASVADGWMTATGANVPSLSTVIRRRDALAARIERLRELGVDADEAELLMLDHDLTSATTVIDRLEEGRRQERREEVLRGAIARLRATSAEDTSEDWVPRLDKADALLATGEYAETERLVQALDNDLRASRRRDSLAELDTTRTRLVDLEAPPSLVLELDEQLSELQARPDKSVDPSLVQRSRERLESLASQRRSELEQHIRAAHDLLDVERDLIQPDALPNLELRLAEVERNMLDGEVMAALNSAAGLLRDIEGQRVHRWTADEGESSLVSHVIDYCTQQLHFDPDDVRRLYVAAKTKPFVILAGLTGSGKSTIARLFAGALGADAGNGRFRRIAVRPDWIDQSEVLGSVNPLSNRFEPGWLAEVARECERNLDQIYVVLLDEMNLAPVEQYLAEYLSGLEELRSGSESTVIPVYSQGASPENAAEWPAVLAFPPNLIVIGTVNVDETTRVLSERVLDRANVLQLSVAVSDAHHRPRSRSVQPWNVPYREWNAICISEPDSRYHGLLVEVGEILQSIGIGVGQRAHTELERFVANCAGVLEPEVGLDLGLLQRIIPKIRGFKRDLAPGLTDLYETLDASLCKRSAAVVARWLADEVPDDDYVDGTDARVSLVR